VNKRSCDIGDLMKLAAWCNNGPALMEIVGEGYCTGRPHVQAIFLEGSNMGTIVDVYKGNLFRLEDYNEAMKKHYANR